MFLFVCLDLNQDSIRANDGMCIFSRLMSSCINKQMAFKALVFDPEMLMIFLFCTPGMTMGLQLGSILEVITFLRCYV